MFVFALYLVTFLGSCCSSTGATRSKANKVCSPYPHVILDHGSIRRLGFQKYSFRCDHGYFLASPATVRCFRGNWTSLNKPKCLRIQGQCDDPPAVDNARIFGEDRHVGAKVKYMCNEGFVLLGHSEMSCSKNGHWDKRAPACMDESEPIQKVAERLKNSFVTELAFHSADTPEGRLLDRASLSLGLDLFLLVDRSSSVDPVHLEQAKKFVKFLLRRFAVRNTRDNREGTRASVVAFGTEVQVVFDIDNATITNAEVAASAVSDIQPNGGGTNMEGALTRVMLESMKLRPEAKKALFLMTDGEPNVANPEITPEDIASTLKNVNGFEIFTVGIGKGIRVSLLNQLASEPPLSHVFILDDYPQLEDLMQIIEDSKPPPPPISRDQCGYNASGEDSPWMATLYIGGVDGPFKICSGVLICSQWVLTAASCLQHGLERVDKKDVFVVLGERHLLKHEKGQTNFYVVDTQVYPRYDPRHDVIENNLALLKMNLPASAYRPACLPPTDRALPLHQNLKINASISGWGTIAATKMTYATANDLTFEMHATSVSLSTEEECPLKKSSATPLCAGQGSKACYGLVGSPLMAEDPSTGYQHVLGILVHRKNCAGGHNQYIELTDWINRDRSGYIDWINRVSSNCHLRHWGLA